MGIQYSHIVRRIFISTHSSYEIINYIHKNFSYEKIKSIIVFLQLLLLFRHSVMSESLRLQRLQHARLPCPSPSPGDYSNSYPLSKWCHPTISSSVVPFCSYLQSFPASGSFLMSQLFSSGCQNIGASASASVFPINIHNSFLLGLTGWISLQAKGLSRVFSNTTVQKHQFSTVQPSLWSSSHIHARLRKN